MTSEEVQDFVTRFAAAWATRDGNAFVELWHTDGTLMTPLVNRPVKGSELARLMEVQTAAAPDFVWQLLDWTWRGNVVIIEWQTTLNVEGRRVEWRGVDKFRIREGKIAEEVVYSDTAPLRAFRSGEKLEPITRFQGGLCSPSPRGRAGRGGKRFKPRASPPRPRSTTDATARS